jgi:uncharacterized protein
MDKVVHFEIPFDDQERAQKFYKELFNWKIEKAGEMPYWMARTVEVDDKQMPKESGAINGGMLKKDEQNDPGSSNPTVVIKVQDIGDTSTKIKESGGEILMEPRKVMDMGLYTRFKDTEGNTVGLWQDLPKDQSKQPIEQANPSYSPDSD